VSIVSDDDVEETEIPPGAAGTGGRPGASLFIPPGATGVARSLGEESEFESGCEGPGGSWARVGKLTPKLMPRMLMKLAKGLSDFFMSD
jgi:hypothetical protein